MNLALAVLLTVFTPPDTLASFPGGDPAFDQYIRSHLKTTQAAVDRNFSGSVAVTFTIDAKGKAADFRIQQPIGYGLDEEAVDVLSGMPRWQPGVIDGRRIRTTFTKRIEFTSGLPVSKRRASEKATPSAAPYFRYSVDDLNAYLAREFRLPKKKKKVEGFVTVKCLIVADGSTRDVQLVSGIDSEIDNEVVRIVSGMKDWEPARSRFVPVESAQRLVFSIAGGKLLFKELQH